MAVNMNSVIVPAHAAGAIPAFVAEPATGSGPGILLLQGIFGVNDYLRRRAVELARSGYVVVAPELYWRIGRGIEIDESAAGALDLGRHYREQVDLSVAIDDAVTVFEHMRSMPGVLRRSGVLGFCLGAGVGFGVATHTVPAAAVLYYGADIAGQLDRAANVRCPLLLHWGGDDEIVPPDSSGRVSAAFARREDVTSHVYPGAGHAFDDDRSPVFTRPEQAAQAWQRTGDFLARTLPIGHR